MLNFCDFIQVYVFTTNHHLTVIHVYIFLLWRVLVCMDSNYLLVVKVVISGKYKNLNKITKI